MSLLTGIAHADPTAAPSLVISQFKVTSSNGQFFTLYNASDQAIDMSTVQLVYFNNYNLSSATSSKLISLSGNLPAHGTYLVNDGPLTLCYRMLINSESLSLSSTAGTVQVQRMTQASNGLVTTQTEDYVRWSKTAVKGVTTLPATDQFLMRKPLDADNNPAVTTPGEGSWQAVKPSAADPCVLNTIQANTAIPPTAVTSGLQLLASTPPPVTIISVTAPYDGPMLPAADVGLKAPIVNEFLANPGTPQTDAEHEFIELYNPNDKSFDLSGFKLAVGLNTKHNYSFPAGTLLKPKSFTAFYSANTHLALSNSGTQVSLLDPFGNSISDSKPSGAAKDNQAWALADKDWFVTVQPTPGKENVIRATGAATSKAAGSPTQSSGAVKGVSTPLTNAAAGLEAGQQVSQPQPVHSGLVASVAALAVGYGAYEYRFDASNRLRQFRNYRAARSKARG